MAEIAAVGRFFSSVERKLSLGITGGGAGDVNETIQYVLRCFAGNIPFRLKWR